MKPESKLMNFIDVETGKNLEKLFRGFLRSYQSRIKFNSVWDFVMSGEILARNDETFVDDFELIHLNKKCFVGMFASF